MAGATSGYNHFPSIAANLPKVLGQVVRKVAFDIQAAAIANAPVDTGFLRNSIYVVTSQSSSYGNAGSPPGDSYLLPPVPTPGDETTAYVAVGANYGIYVEMGTRYMAAQPYFQPAVDVGQQEFDAALASISDKLDGRVTV